MSNPFLEPYNGVYLKFVDAQIKDMEKDDSKKISVGEKDTASLRMSLKKLEKRRHWELKTKKDSDGDLWVKRTK